MSNSFRSCCIHACFFFFVCCLSLHISWMSLRSPCLPLRAAAAPAASLTSGAVLSHNHPRAFSPPYLTASSSENSRERLHAGATTRHLLELQKQFSLEEFTQSYSVCLHYKITCIQFIIIQTYSQLYNFNIHTCIYLNPQPNPYGTYIFFEVTVY